MLYIILRHRDDREQKWDNRWSEADSRIIVMIQTTKDLAARCEQERVNGNRVAIYRCAYKGAPPTISCVASIEKTFIAGDSMSYVTFCNQNPLSNVTPPRVAEWHQVHFENDYDPECIQREAA